MLIDGYFKTAHTSPLECPFVVLIENNFDSKSESITQLCMLRIVRWTTLTDHYNKMTLSTIKWELECFRPQIGIAKLHCRMPAGQING